MIGAGDTEPDLLRRQWRGGLSRRSRLGKFGTHPLRRAFVDSRLTAGNGEAQWSVFRLNAAALVT
jgi:hypothetical protein